MFEAVSESRDYPSIELPSSITATLHFLIFLTMSSTTQTVTNDPVADLPSPDPYATPPYTNVFRILTFPA